MHLKVFLWWLYGQMHSKSSSETTFSLCNSILFKINCSATKGKQQGSIRRPKFKRYTNIIKFFFGKSALKRRNEGWRKKKREQAEKERRGKKEEERRDRKGQPTWNKSRGNYCKIMSYFTCRTSEVRERLSFPDTKCLTFWNFQHWC